MPCCLRLLSLRFPYPFPKSLSQGQEFLGARVVKTDRGDYASFTDRVFESCERGELTGSRSYGQDRRFRSGVMTQTVIPLAHTRCIYARAIWQSLATCI